MTLEECISIALNNAKFFVTTSGNAEFRQNVAAQFTSGTADQFGSIYDVAIGQSTTQSVPQGVDGNGNRLLPRGVLRANQIGGVEDALAEFDAQASGFVDYSTTDRPSNNIPSGVTNPVNVATNVTQQGAISKRFATGGVATLRQQTLYSLTNTPSFNPATNQGLRAVPSDWTALLEAQVQHPLMRNRGTLINRIPVVLASLNEDISIVDFEVQVRNLVRDVEVAYWDLYVAYRNVSTTIIGRNSAMATAQIARLNLKNGTGTRQDVAQAVGQYYLFRGSMETALAGSNLLGDDRFGVYGRERALRELLGEAATDGRLIRPIDEPTLARVEFDWNESVAQLLYLSPELRRDKVRIKQSELELISAKNQILPDVNLSLLYRWVGVGDTFGPPNGRGFTTDGPFDGSSALAGLTSGNFQEGSVRLEITPPAFGARRELTRIRGAQLRLVREKAFLQEAERLYVSQLSDAVAKAATHFQLVQTNAQRWQATEQEVAARLAEFKGGRSPVNTVLQSQERRAQAQIAYYRALGEYNKSINYVDYLRGTLLANNNITLAEGPWNQKAYWDALERARERSAGRQYKWGVTRPGVVRQGPVGDAEHATHAIGSGVVPGDQTLPPGDAVWDDAMGLNLDPHRQPIDVHDKPLSEMGSPAEMLSPDPSAREIEALAPGLANPDSDPTNSRGSIKINGPSVLVPSERSTPPAAASGDVTSASFENDIGISYAPEPVQRKPVPTGKP